MILLGLRRGEKRRQDAGATKSGSESADQE
jgi:hypothetical protein